MMSWAGVATAEYLSSSGSFARSFGGQRREIDLAGAAAGP
jgi:hypothetical protein